MVSTEQLDEAPQRKLSTKAKHRIIGWTFIGLTSTSSLAVGRALAYWDQNQKADPYESALSAVRKCKLDIAGLSETARLTALSAKLLDDCRIDIPDEPNGAKIEDATILLPNQAALDQTIASDEQAIHDASVNAPRVLAETALFGFVCTVGVASVQLGSGTGIAMSRE